MRWSPTTNARPARGRSNGWRYPRSSACSSGALKQAKFVLTGLEVDADRMRANIDLTHGLVMSEAVMMGLGPYLGREYAHDLVYDLCRQAIAERRPLIEILAAHPEITKHVDRRQLEAMVEPANHLGQAGVMVDRVVRHDLRQPAVPVRLRQRVRHRGAARRAAGRPELAAALPLRPVCRAVLGHGLHRAAPREPPLLALPHPAGGTAPAVRAHRAAARVASDFGADRRLAEPAALESAADAERRRPTSSTAW